LGADKRPQRATQVTRRSAPCSPGSAKRSAKDLRAGTLLFSKHLEASLRLGAFSLGQWAQVLLAVVLALTFGIYLSPLPSTPTILRDMLSEPDRQLVEELRLYRRETTGIHLPEPAFRAWQRVVEETEGGNVDSNEYANDLNVRDDLEDWVAQISPTGKERWLELIAPLDKRFENATRHIARPVYDPEGKARRWFWYRVPVRMDQRTEAEFRGLGRL
jgi:hypothetical protein